MFSETIDDRRNTSERPEQQTSPLAVVSIVCSLLGPCGALPAIVCGHLARSDCRRDPTVSGAGLALTGLLIGYAFLILTLVLGAVVLLGVLAAKPSVPPFIYELQ